MFDYLGRLLFSMGDPAIDYTFGEKRSNSGLTKPLKILDLGQCRWPLIKEFVLWG